MFKLMVSRDCGYSYSCYDQSKRIENLIRDANRFDEEGLRWVIEDEVGDIKEASRIHREIINFMQAVRIKETNREV